MLRRLTASFGCFLLLAFGAAFAQDVDALLLSLFGEGRPSGADVMHLRNGEVMRGTVVSERFTLRTGEGTRTFQVRDCAGISFGLVGAGVDQVVTIGSERCAGSISDSAIRFCQETSGVEMGMAKQEVLYLLLRRDVGSVGRHVTRVLGTPGQGTVSTVLTKRTRSVVRGTMRADDDPLLKVFPDQVKHQPVTVVVGQGATQVSVSALGKGLTTVTSAVMVIPDPVEFALPGLVEHPLRMRLLPAGTFTMGASLAEKGRDDREWPRHQVTISKPFAIGVHEVTQQQWYAVMGSLPSQIGVNPDHPVTQVSWGDVQAFIKKLNAMSMGTFRLPTEAEWEYACRAGADTRFYWGNDEQDREIGEYAWTKANSDEETHPVGQKEPNTWGLHDMSGNVWEWCSDWMSDYTAESQVDPAGSKRGYARICRGGSWGHSSRYSRSSNRNWEAPAMRGLHLGFRLVLVTE